MRITGRHPLTLPVLLLTSAVIAMGCARKAAEAPPQPAPAPPNPVAHAQPPAPAPTQTPAPLPTPGLTSGDFTDAHFDFDKYDLRQDARTALDGDARMLRDHPGTRITLEGHCDERGTVEYNQALGERRAHAAKTYLIAAGVDSTSIQTISYGKDRPFCTEHEETCWAKNRCAHIVVRNGPA